MSVTRENRGRLCNQIIRNLSLSILAKKYDLYVDYSNYENINNKLGIGLFIGKNKYNKTIKITKNNYMDFYKKKIKTKANFDFMDCYFQTVEITNLLHQHLKTNKKTIIEKNPYKERYNKNNDIFIHIRLTDTKKWNAGIKYYLHCIKLINYDNIYIGSDDFEDILLKKLKIVYPNIIFFKKNPVETIQFASTCKNIILSHGSFSAVIGYLSFYSTVYFLNKNPGWCPLSMLKNKGFIEINFRK